MDGWHDRWAGGISLALKGMIAGLGGISLALGALTLELDGIVAGLGRTHDAEPPPGFSASPTFTSLLGSSVPRSGSP